MQEQQIHLLNDKSGYLTPMMPMEENKASWERPPKHPMVLLYMVRALQMVLKPCARNPKQTMVLLYMV